MLGATGSIGGSTLDVIARHPERYRVHALTAHRSREALLALCHRHRPAVAVLEREADAAWLRERLGEANLPTEVRTGPAAEPLPAPRGRVAFAGDALSPAVPASSSRPVGSATARLHGWAFIASR